MVQVSYPGVYIQEVPSGVRTITGVATSVTAFVGFTRKGALDQAVSITSFADFERSHGGLDRDSALSYAVRQFYLNGGSQALIVRVAKNTQSARWSLLDGGGATAAGITAVNAGAWANTLQISVNTTDVRNPDVDFNLVVSQLQADGVTVLPLETHRNLNLNRNSVQFVESVVNNASSNIRVTRDAALIFNQAGFAVSKPLVFPLAASNGLISGTLDGVTSFILMLSGTSWASMGDLLTAVTNAIATAGLAAQLSASESDASGGVGGGHLKLTSTRTDEFSAVAVGLGTAGGLAAVAGMGLANGGREISGDAQHRLAVINGLTPSLPGADGEPGGATELIGSDAAKSGMQALRNVDIFNLLCIPETAALPEADGLTVIDNALTLCTDRRAFLIADPPAGKTQSNIAAWVTNAKSTYAAMYFPQVRVADPLDAMRLRSIAPSGTLAGIYARTDATRGVWKAPAGTDALLRGVIELAQTLNDTEQGLLNPKGVNVLRGFPAQGRVVWGARTTMGADGDASEYKYIPIRRLALFIEESLYRGTQWVVFEPNDEPLYAQIRLNVGAFLNGLFRQGAFQGSTPRDAYFVKCDRETTTQNDRNLGIVNILVGFAPLKPAEFVVISIQQIAGDIQT